MGNFGEGVVLECYGEELRVKIGLVRRGDLRVKVLGFVLFSFLLFFYSLGLFVGFYGCRVGYLEVNNVYILFGEYWRVRDTRF